MVISESFWVTHLQKPKKLALIAVARKLLVVVCAILNSQKPYEENHISYYNKDLVQIA